MSVEQLVIRRDPGKVDAILEGNGVPGIEHGEGGYFGAIKYFNERKMREFEKEGRCKADGKILRTRE